MNKNNEISFLLAIYLYATSIVLIIKPIVDFGFMSHILMVIIFLCAVSINQFIFRKKFLLVYGIIFILLGFNLLFTKTFGYVLGDAMYLVTYSLFPVYLFMHFELNVMKFIDKWYKLSLFFTISLPIYYIYLEKGNINYFEFGFITHINIIILSLVIFIYKKKGIVFHSVLLLINISFLVVLGSRMVVLASIICIFVAFICSKKDFKFFLLGTTSLTIIIYLIMNLNEILVLIYGKLQTLGISSRNLRMFILQLETNNISSNDILLSGRDAIYPVIIDYLKIDGIWPSGLAMTRTITNGSYAHTHNFILEIFVVFGIVFAPILLIYFFIKSLSIRFSRIKYIFLVFFVSYFVRSLTGTYFILDPIFMVILGILLAKSPIDRRGNQKNEKKSGNFCNNARL